jgi:hypothetical protein
MEFSLKVAWPDGFSPVRDRALVDQEHWRCATLGTREKQENLDHHMRVFCHQLWEQPQINWDGRVLGCCCNHWGDFGGNAFRDGLLASLNNESLQYARQMLLGKKVPREDIPCTVCSAYLSMKATGDFLKRGLPRMLFRSARHAYRSWGVRRLHQWSRGKISPGPTAAAPPPDEDSR